MKTLSIRQPWAWLIIHGPKDIENRSWATSHRGPLFIHASKGLTASEYAIACEVALSCDPSIQIPDMEDLDRGGVIGMVTVADCISASDSPWFFGPFGFVLTEKKHLPFFPCPGKLGLFDVIGFVDPPGSDKSNRNPGDRCRFSDNHACDDTCVRECRVLKAAKGSTTWESTISL